MSGEGQNQKFTKGKVSSVRTDIFSKEVVSQRSPRDFQSEVGNSKSIQRKIYQQIKILKKEVRLPYRWTIWMFFKYPEYFEVCCSFAVPVCFLPYQCDCRLAVVLDISNNSTYKYQSISDLTCSSQDQKGLSHNVRNPGPFCLVLPSLGYCHLHMVEDGLHLYIYSCQQ